MFCFSWFFSGISTCMSTYRGKSSVLDFSTAGMLTGAAFKFSLGLKGMISGGKCETKI